MFPPMSWFTFLHDLAPKTGSHFSGSYPDNTTDQAGEAARLEHQETDDQRAEDELAQGREETRDIRGAAGAPQLKQRAQDKAATKRS